MHITRLILLTALSATLSCATKTLNVQETQKNFSETLQRSDATVQNAQTDFRDKNSLFENLKKTGAKEFKSVEFEITKQMKDLDSAFQEVQKHRRAMTQLSSDTAGLAHAQTILKAGSPEYAQVKTATEAFEAASQQLNRALVEYSLTSNNLADFITTRKLFFNYDLLALRKRVQSELGQARKTIESMQRDLNQNSERLDHVSSQSKETAVAKHNEIVATAIDYSASAENLAAAMKEIENMTAGAKKISSLNELWPQVKIALAGIDSGIEKMNALQETFTKQMLKMKAFANPAPESVKPSEEGD